MPSAVEQGSVTGLDDTFAGTPFRALKRLAAGGMGEVFLVLHEELGREFVAKVLHEQYATDERMLDRMRIEAQVLGRLNHPNIVSVTGFGVTLDKRPFIVMEHLLGRTLAAEVAARGRLPPLEAISYTRQLLQALRAAHAVGIVHRDIKPANLFLVDRTQEARTLRVLDFGLARVLPGFSDAAPQPLALPTSAGQILGTPHFLSPEGSLGKKVDERADIYGVGLVLYVLLAGRGPFDELRSRSEILRAHAQARPLAPSVAAGFQLPAGLDKVVLYALRKEPADRYQTAEHFENILEQFEASLRRHPSTGSRALQPAPLPASASVASPSLSTARTRWLPDRRQLLLIAAVAMSTAVACSEVVRAILSRPS